MGTTSLERSVPADLTNANQSSRPHLTGTGILAEFLSTTGPEDVFRPAPITKSKKSAISLPFFRRKRAASQTSSSATLFGGDVQPRVTFSGKAYGEIRIPDSSWNETCARDSAVECRNDDPHDQGSGSSEVSNQAPCLLLQSSGTKDEMFPKSIVREQASLDPSHSYDESKTILSREDSRPDLMEPTLWPMPQPRSAEMSRFEQLPMQFEDKSLRETAPSGCPKNAFQSIEQLSGPLSRQTRQLPGIPDRQSPREIVRSDEDIAQAAKSARDASGLPLRITSFLRQETATRSNSYQTTSKSSLTKQVSRDHERGRRSSTESSFSDVLDFNPDDQHISPILLSGAATQRSHSLPQPQIPVEQTHLSLQNRRSLGEQHTTMAEKIQKLGERNKYLEATIAALLADKNHKPV